MLFKQCTSIGDLGATLADFGTDGSVFKSCLHLFFFLVKMLVSLGYEPGACKYIDSHGYPNTTETEVLMQKKNQMPLC